MQLIGLKGGDAINRGIDLVQRGRIDAFYHPSPIKIYQSNNQKFKAVACSYFHGHQSEVYVAVSPTMSSARYEKINRMYTEAINTSSYEYYFAK